ncbi:hypothetical protein JM93_02359 [Roseibium hamelinense]|uniref:Uncharacterized protein n=1 Tax=Roseibium hamelinense TaxID=150831 RepID=A0A562T0Q5_9HYPH|nr:S8/S53 family peptidase [Roseibium hamelinense]TWI87121.1 hypothetical protein JM93_02359 [Roseibium hamelinense]
MIDTAKKKEIINFSGSYSHDEILNDADAAFPLLYKKNATIVQALGNSTELDANHEKSKASASNSATISSSLKYPGCILVVGGLNKNQHDSKNSIHTSPNDPISSLYLIKAPCDFIATASYKGGGDKKAYSGTSFAAPLVSSLVHRLNVEFPDNTLAENNYLMLLGVGENGAANLDSALSNAKVYKNSGWDGVAKKVLGDDYTEAKKVTNANFADAPELALMAKKLVSDGKKNVLDAASKNDEFMALDTSQKTFVLGAMSYCGNKGLQQDYVKKLVAEVDGKSRDELVDFWKNFSAAPLYDCPPAEQVKIGSDLRTLAFDNEKTSQKLKGKPERVDGGMIGAISDIKKISDINAAKTISKLDASQFKPIAKQLAENEAFAPDVRLRTTMRFEAAGLDPSPIYSQLGVAATTGYQNELSQLLSAISLDAVPGNNFRLLSVLNGVGLKDLARSMHEDANNELSQQIVARLQDKSYADVKTLLETASQLNSQANDETISRSFKRALDGEVPQVENQNVAEDDTTEISDDANNTANAGDLGFDSDTDGDSSDDNSD